MANSADPDQLATNLDLHCLQRQDICGTSRTRIKVDSEDSDQPIPMHRLICLCLVQMLSCMTCCDPAHNVLYHTFWVGCLQSSLNVHTPKLLSMRLSLTNEIKPCVCMKSKQRLFIAMLFLSL